LCSCDSTASTLAKSVHWFRNFDDVSWGLTNAGKILLPTLDSMKDILGIKEKMKACRQYY